MRRRLSKGLDTKLPGNHDQVPSTGYWAGYRVLSLGTGLLVTD